MNVDDKEILEELGRLRALSRSDISMLACREARGHLIRWKYASGNLNERYKKFKHKSGEGLAGKVLRIGRPVWVNTGQEKDRIRVEYPIMLAEHLLAAAALPVASAGKVYAVLLIGSRSDRQYGQTDIDILAAGAERIASFLQAGYNIT